MTRSAAQMGLPKKALRRHMNALAERDEREERDERQEEKRRQEWQGVGEVEGW